MNRCPIIPFFSRQHIETIRDNPNKSTERFFLFVYYRNPFKIEKKMYSVRPKATSCSSRKQKGNQMEKNQYAYVFSFLFGIPGSMQKSLLFLLVVVVCAPFETRRRICRPNFAYELGTHRVHTKPERKIQKIELPPHFFRDEHRLFYHNFSLVFFNFSRKLKNQLVF